MHSWLLLQDLLVIILAAFLLGTLAERLRQSALIGYLLAGTLIGPPVLGLVADAHRIELIAELGVALLLFTIGLEFSIKHLRELGARLLLAGAAQIVATLLLTAALAWLLRVPPRMAITIGVLVTLSSTACVIRVLNDRAALDSVYGRASLAILLTQDVAVIPLLILVGAINGGSVQESLALIGRTVVGGVLLVVALYGLLNYVVPPLLGTQSVARNRELPILLSAAIALGAAFAAHFAGLSPALGAFVAGALLGGSPFATQIRADVATLKTLLVTLFFASVGMLADLQWFTDHLFIVLLITLLVLVGKTLIVWIILRQLGYSHGPAIATGLCVANIGEFAFVLAEAAKTGAANAAAATATATAPTSAAATHATAAAADVAASAPHPEAAFFQLIVSVAILSLMLTPLLVAFAPLAARWIERRIRSRSLISIAPGSPSQTHAGRRTSSNADNPELADCEVLTPGAASHIGPAPQIIVVGFGPAGEMVAGALYDQFAEKTLVLELNPQSARRAEGLGLRVLIGDATHGDVLSHIRLNEARIIIITIPDPDAAATILQQCRMIAPDAMVIVRSRYHVRHIELLLAGAHEVVDEEQQVGLRMAELAREMMNASPNA